MLRKILLIVFFIYPLYAIAQVPQWKNGYFEELCNSYIETVSGSGNTEEIAINNAINELIRKRDLATGSSITISGSDIFVDGELIVMSRIIDKHIEQRNGKWIAYFLTQTAKRLDSVIDPVMVTDKYDSGADIGRSFVPGMQQIYKGQKAKGSLFIAGEVVCVGGIVLGECMRSSYVNLIGSTTNSKNRAIYTTKANNWTNVRTGFIVGAAAVYVWNVIDGIVAKGARRVKHKNFDCALVPYSNCDASGLAFNINF